MITSNKVISNSKLRHAAKRAFLIGGTEDESMGALITGHLEIPVSPSKYYSCPDQSYDLFMRFTEKNHTTTINDGKEKSIILQTMTTSKRIIILLSPYREEHLSTVTNPLLSNSEDIKKQDMFPDMFINS